MGSNFRGVCGEGYSLFSFVGFRHCGFCLWSGEHYCSVFWFEMMRSDAR